MRPRAVPHPPGPGYGLGLHEAPLVGESWYGKFKATASSHRRMEPHAAPGAESGLGADPTRLVVLLFVVGTLLAVGVGYLGSANLLGGSIPGTYPGHGGGSPTCEGRNVTGTYHFVLIAGERGDTNYNGTNPGPCLKVGVGSSVEVTLRVDPAAGSNHSWDLIPGTGPTNASPVFPGAGLTGPTRFTGLPPGTVKNFSFNATTVGLFRYVCEVDDHSTLGMMGWFNVTSTSALSGHAALSFAAASGASWRTATTQPTASVGGRYMAEVRSAPEI
ncbi:MAG: hypothetical protein L3K13_00330 [Thermoplasmata archaeon]|nr:hypothetical protein [Thermoplasmata archaeon]